MAKIIRPNLVNTVRSSQMSTVLRGGGVFVALLLAALLLLLAEWYLRDPGRGRWRGRNPPTAP